jgi:hypothetical protein
MCVPAVEVATHIYKGQVPNGDGFGTLIVRLGSTAARFQDTAVYTITANGRIRSHSIQNAVTVVELARRHELHPAQHLFHLPKQTVGGF